jgi:hypothetical protein
MSNELAEQRKAVARVLLERCNQFPLTQRKLLDIRVHKRPGLLCAGRHGAVVGNSRK